MDSSQDNSQDSLHEGEPVTDFVHHTKAVNMAAGMGTTGTGTTVGTSTTVGTATTTATATPSEKFLGMKERRKSSSVKMFLGDNLGLATNPAILKVLAKGGRKRVVACQTQWRVGGRASDTSPSFICILSYNNRVPFFLSSLAPRSSIYSRHGRSLLRHRRQDQ